MLRYAYSDVVREGVRTPISMLPDGGSIEAFDISALSTYKNAIKRVWRWPNVFDLKARRGFRRGGILLELEEQLDTSRILGPSQFRVDVPHADIPHGEYYG